MDESTMDDRWCAKSVCGEAIDALEASRAEGAAIRHQLDDLCVVAPELTDEECDRLCAWTHPSSRGTYYADIDRKGFRRAFAEGFRRGRLTGTPADVVTVPREEERRTWRDFSAGWAAARRSTPRQSSDEECAVRDGLASAWIEAMNGIDALRSGEAVATPPQDTVTMSREEWDTKCAELASAIRMLWMVEDRFSSASYSEHRQIQGEVERWLESHDPEQIHFATIRTSAQAPAQRGEE